MRITEEEKKNILSKYFDNTSDELLRHLKRTYPIYENKLDWMTEPMKFIQINDKIRYIKGNKKYLVNTISSNIDESWHHLGDDVIRRTVKKFIDGIMI